MKPKPWRPAGNKKLKHLLLTIALIWVPLVYFMLRGPADRTVGEPGASVVVAPSGVPLASGSPAPAGGGSVLESLPSLDTLRKEREQNPHGMPPSMKRLSDAMAPRMEEALRSEKKAIYLMSELETCVRAGASHSVQAYCLANARQLGKRYPRLNDRVNVLEKAASEEVHQTLKALGY